MNDNATAAATPYRGSDKLLLGIVLAVVTFWLFAQTTLNIASTMRADLRISESLNNISVSIAALFSGIFIVVAGGLADRIGRMKITYAGLALSILGSLLIAISPAGTAVFHRRTHLPRSLSRLHYAGDARLFKSVFPRSGTSARGELLVDRLMGWLRTLLVIRRLDRSVVRLAVDFLDVDRCRCH